jgi:hypothetical protein
MFQGLINKVLDFNEDAFRNIPSILISEDLLDDLSPDRQDRAIGEAIVSEQKEQYDFEIPIIMRPFTYGKALSDAPYGRFPTRFSDGKRFSVWYGSLDLLTSVYETAYHFKKRLADMLTEIDKEVASERRVFRVHVEGILVDLRGKRRTFPLLHDTKDYSFTHSVSTYLFDKGQSGLLVESARYHDGVNIAAFKPDILSNPRHHSYMIYRWKPGDSALRIEKTRGRTWKVINI